MKRTKLVFASTLALALGSLVAVTGCSGSTTAVDPTSSATAAQTTRVAAVAPGAKSGRVRMMADLLSTVPLRDDQRAEIEKLASDADARHAATAGLHEDIMKTLAAQVEAGQINRPALQAKIDAAADAANAAHPADEAALQRLHAILTPEQRGQVADAMQAHHGHGPGHEMEHGEAHGAHMDRMHQWATDLKLTDAQQEQIKAIFAGMRAAHAAEHEHGEAGGDMKAMHEHAEHGKAFAESFRSDTLTLPPPKDAHVIANAMADHFIGVAQAVLPILTPEQRALAAAKLREHAAGGVGHEMPIGE
jgi:Spy/CpxP family protein refolding chaperone